MATFNLQNNVVNAFFLNVDVERQFVALLQRSITTLKGQKVLAKCITMAMLKLHSGVKRDVAFPFLMAGCFLFDFLHFGN